MKIGSKYKFVEVMARPWEQFVTEAGLLRAQQYQGNHHPVIDQIVTLFDQRSALVITASDGSRC